MKAVRGKKARTKLRLQAQNSKIGVERRAAGIPSRLRSLKTEHTALAAVSLITVIGLGLRVYALGHGLPYQYVPDESTMVGGALRMGASMSLQPPSFTYPALLMYLFASEYLGLFAVGRITGLFPSVAHFREYAFTDPTLFYLLPRLAIALAGSVAVPMIYLIGRKLYGTWAGVVAAGLMATSLMHVQLSHEARHWGPITFLGIATLWVSLNLAQGGRRRDYLLSSLVVGLAAATSFNGIMLIALPLAAHWIHLRQRGSKLLSLRAHLPMLQALVLTPIVFLALNPYVLLHFDRFLAYQTTPDPNTSSIFVHIGTHYDNYLAVFLEKQSFPYFAWTALSYEPAIVLLAIPGAVIAIREGRSMAFLVLIYPLFHYLVFGFAAPSKEQRYILPALALLTVPAGLAGARLLAWLSRRLGGNERAAISTAVVALLLLAIVALPSLRFNWLLSQTDTRTLAKSWIESAIPQGANIAIESYAPPLTPSLDALRAQQQEKPGSLGARDQWLLEKGLPDGEVSYQLMRLSVIDSSPTVDNLTPYLQTHDHRYFVVSDFRWKSSHRSHQELKAYLAKNGRLLTIISPSDDTGYVPSDLLDNLENPLSELWKVERPGPLIAIYEVIR